MPLSPETNRFAFVKTLSHLKREGYFFTNNPQTGMTDGVVLVEPNKAPLQDLDALVGAAIDDPLLAISIVHFGENQPHEIDRKTLDPLRDGKLVNGKELQPTEVADELHLAQTIYFHQVKQNAA